MSSRSRLHEGMNLQSGCHYNEQVCGREMGGTERKNGPCAVVRGSGEEWTNVSSLFANWVQAWTAA